MDPIYAPLTSPPGTIRQLTANAAAVFGIFLIAAGFWLAADAAALSQRANRPDQAIWAMRAIAVALVAAAQVIFAAVVVPNYFPRRGIERAISIGCGFVVLGATITAIVFALRAW